MEFQSTAVIGWLGKCKAENEECDEEDEEDNEDWWRISVLCAIKQTKNEIDKMYRKIFYPCLQYLNYSKLSFVEMYLVFCFKAASSSLA